MWLILADGTEREVVGHLTLEVLQHLLGGYVEHLALEDGRHLFVDEDGKLKEKPRNEKATSLFYPTMDVIVGDVLILTDEEFTGMKPNVRWLLKPT